MTRRRASLSFISLDRRNIDMSNTSFYQRSGKRVVDFLAAAVGLIAVGPIFLVIAALIKLSSPGPVFFRQIRVGQFSKPFRMFKFRSMARGSSGPGALLTCAADPRVTPLGRRLRKSKLDELPQLINVLRGEMSLVGPRPEVPEYVSVYSEEQLRVLLTKPGITGLVAINNVQEEELLATQSDKHSFYQRLLLPAKLKLDLLYCRNVRFTEDLRILVVTFLKIFQRSAASPSPLLPSSEKQTWVRPVG